MVTRNNKASQHEKSSLLARDSLRNDVVTDGTTINRDSAAIPSPTPAITITAIQTSVKVTTALEALMALRHVALPPLTFT
jgi:hypothetical protein